MEECFDARISFQRMCQAIKSRCKEKGDHTTTEQKDKIYAEKRKSEEIKQKKQTFTPKRPNYSVGSYAEFSGSPPSGSRKPTKSRKPANEEKYQISDSGNEDFEKDDFNENDDPDDSNENDDPDDNSSTSSTRSFSSADVNVRARASASSANNTNANANNANNANKNENKMEISPTPSPTPQKIQGNDAASKIFNEEQEEIKGKQEKKDKNVSNSQTKGKHNRVMPNKKI